MRIAPIIAILTFGLMFSGVDGAELPESGTLKSLGISVHSADPTREEMRLIADGGWPLIRMDMNWNRVETVKGKYDFAYGGKWPVDVLYERWSGELGNRALFILCDVGRNELYGSHWSQTWQDGFVKFSAAVAAHYRGSNNIYEILNEPFMDPITESPELYVNLARRVARAMREVDPDVTLIGPTVSPRVAPDYLKAWFRLGLLDIVDAVSLHPYTFQRPPEEIVSMYADVRRWMQTHGGKALPLVSSEAGWYTTTPGLPLKAQADYLVRYHLINLSQAIFGSIQYSFRDARDNPRDPEARYGVMATPNEPSPSDAKPAYRAMQRLVAALRGKRFNTRIDYGCETVWLLVFTAPNGDETLAAWTTVADGRTVEVPGWGTLKLTATPLYVDRAARPK